MNEMHLDAVGILEEDGHPVPPALNHSRRGIKIDLVLQPLVDCLYVVDAEAHVPEPGIRKSPRTAVGFLSIWEVHELYLYSAEAHDRHPISGPLDVLQELEAQELVELYRSLQVLHYDENVVEDAFRRQRESLSIPTDGTASLKSLARRRQELKVSTSSIALMLRGVELIIYDLDGVVIDSTKAICTAFNQAIEDVGERSRPEEEILGMIGVALEEMFRRVLPEEKHDRIGCCFDRYLAIFSEVSPIHTRILDGVEETLRYFEAKGVKQTLATNKSSVEAERILGDLGIRHLFDLVLGLNDVDAPKPSPEMILLTLERMDVEPGKVVLVEDSPTGLAAGKASGVHTVAVTTGTHVEDVLVPWEPEYTLECIRGLMEVVATT